MYLHSGNPPVSATRWAEGASLLHSSRGSASRYFHAYIFVTESLSFVVVVVVVVVVLVLVVLLLLSFKSEEERSTASTPVTTLP